MEYQECLRFESNSGRMYAIKRRIKDRILFYDRYCCSFLSDLSVTSLFPSRKEAHDKMNELIGNNTLVTYTLRLTSETEVVDGTD